QAGDAIEQELNGRNHHVTVTSYYRMVLLTGEVTAENDRARAQILAQGVEGVRGVYNDLVVMPPAGVLSRSQDAYITSKVRAHLIHANGVPAASVKVLTERGTVYLMGRLTYQEAQTTTKAIQQVDGVQRVARIIDFIPDTAAIDSSTSTVTSDDSDVAVDAVTSPPAPSDAEARPITQPDIQPSP
ncbi:MAG: BON domain-containing protein, partial [Burkholderiaceae bacterium]|nr:BON domain-containing protein [Burkholderiaceae bacterium]